MSLFRHIKPKDMSWY